MRLTITGLSYTLLIITKPHDDSCILSHSEIRVRGKRTQKIVVHHKSAIPAVWKAICV